MLLIECLSVEFVNFCFSCYFLFSECGKWTSSSSFSSSFSRATVSAITNHQPLLRTQFLILKEKFGRLMTVIPCIRGRLAGLLTTISIKMIRPQMIERKWLIRTNNKGKKDIPVLLDVVWFHIHHITLILLTIVVVVYLCNSFMSPLTFVSAFFLGWLRGWWGMRVERRLSVLFSLAVLAVSLFKFVCHVRGFGSLLCTTLSLFVSVLFEICCVCVSPPPRCFVYLSCSFAEDSLCQFFFLFYSRFL